jgi:hypothetical protein
MFHTQVNDKALVNISWNALQQRNWMPSIKGQIWLKS